MPTVSPLPGQNRGGSTCHREALSREEMTSSQHRATVGISSSMYPFNRGSIPHTTCGLDGKEMGGVWGHLATLRAIMSVTAAVEFLLFPGSQSPAVLCCISRCFCLNLVNVFLCFSVFYLPQCIRCYVHTYRPKDKNIYATKHIRYALRTQTNICTYTTDHVFTHHTYIPMLA